MECTATVEEGNSILTRTRAVEERERESEAIRSRQLECMKTTTKRERSVDFIFICLDLGE